jgi:hypothetical protein
MDPRADIRSLPPGPDRVHLVAHGALASFGTARQEAKP